MWYILVIISVFIAACAQMLLKKATKQHYAPIWRQYINPWVIGGYAILGLTMLSNIFAMSKGVKLKEASTIESLSYLFVPVLAFFFFDERITWRKSCAIGIIIVGILIFFN